MDGGLICSDGEFRDAETVEHMLSRGWITEIDGILVVHGAPVAERDFDG